MLRRPYSYSKAIIDNNNTTLPSTTGVVSAAQPTCTTLVAMRDGLPYTVSTNVPRRFSPLDLTRYNWSKPQINPPTPSCTETSKQETNSPGIISHTAFDAYMNSKINADRPGHEWGIATPTRRQQDTINGMYVQLKTPTYTDTPPTLPVLAKPHKKSILRKSAHDRIKKTATSTFASEDEGNDTTTATTTTTTTTAHYRLPPIHPQPQPSYCPSLIRSSSAMSCTS